MIARLALCGALVFAFVPSIALAGAPVVEVTDVGKGKKELIAFTPKAGDAIRFTMDLELAQEMSIMGAMVMPGMRVTSVDRIDEVRDDGTFVATGEIVEAAWYEIEGSTVSLEDVRSNNPSDLVGTRTTVVVDRFGRVVQASEDGASIASPAAGVSDGVIWPDVPVGVGASWRVVSELESGGVKAQQTVTYTLASRRGERVVVDAVVAQTAAPQQVTNQGMTFDVTDFKGEGSGRVTVDLGERIPVESAFDLAVTLGMSPVGLEGMPAGLGKLQATSRVKVRSARVP